MILETLLLTISLLAWAFYRYITSTFNHWKKKGIFYLKPTPLFGNMKERILLRKSVHDFQRDIYRACDGHKFVGVFEGRRPVLMVRDPELLKQILVRDFDHFVDRFILTMTKSPYIHNSLLNVQGQRWKSLRTLMTPTFSSGKLKAMHSLVEQCGQHLSAFLHDQTANKNKSIELEMKSLFTRFALDVIATCAFGMQSDSIKDPEAEFLKIAMSLTEVSFTQRLLIFSVILITPQLGNYFAIDLFNKQAASFLVSLLKKTKDERMENKDKRRNDFLQLMIDASEEELASSNNDKESNTTESLNMPSKRILDEETIIAQSMLFLLAGFETSSTLLTFASYELTVNQKIQEKLRNEIEEVLAKHGGNCSYEALLEMTFLEMVLSESMRKHPPVPKAYRTCTQPYIIPGTKINIDRDDIIAIPIMGLHHDPHYFPQPEIFDPDRFLPENKNARPPYSYIPFGTGPRQCIGMRFALMSTKIAMVHLIKNFYLTATEKTDIPLKYKRSSPFPVAENGIWLKFERI